jgi:medium-chain acyl-[acyl-carrier-protein] hydrolase
MVADILKNPWLFVRKPQPQAILRLFCFPYAGGAALIFRTWADALPIGVEVCPVQYPGRGARLREPPYTKMSLMVESLAEALLPFFDKPFAFFGHSMGATISFELTRVLSKRHGIEPVHLFVSGRTAPHMPDAEPPTYALPEPEFIEDLRRLNGTPKEVLENAELLQLMIPIIRADFELIQTYAYDPGPPVNCPITAFGGLQDVEVGRERLEGWREMTASSFVLRMLQGDHFFLHSAEPILLRSLSQDLGHVLHRLGNSRL